MNLHELREISEYENIPELVIIDCYHLSLNGLGNHKKIDFSGSRVTASFSQFQDCESVSLQYPVGTPTIDINTFTNAKFLELRDPLPITVTALPKLRFLRINYSSIEWTFLLPFSLLESAEFHFCKFSDISSLQNIKNLCFRKCKGSIDLRKLTNLQKLSLELMETITDVSMLGNLYQLCLSDCPAVTDISSLGKIKKLRIINCKNIKSLEGLGRGNSEVVIAGLGVVDFSPLQSVWKVALDRCENFTDANNLKDVKHLTLRKCSSLRDVSALANLASFALVDCERVKSLKGLGNVPRIYPEGCSELEDIADLGSKQKVLVIRYCAKLTTIKQDQTQKYENIRNIPNLRLNEDSEAWFQPWLLFGTSLKII